MTDLKELKRPFHPNKVKWRIQQSGISNNGNLWARAVAYIDARDVMERLDNVLGMYNWQDEYQQVDGAYICKLSIKGKNEWITKNGVAEIDDDNSGPNVLDEQKSSASGALKRAGVKFGIARYLYNLEEDFVDETEKGTDKQNVDGWHKGTITPKNNKTGDDYVNYCWKEPELPTWALPLEVRKEMFIDYIEEIDERLEDYDIEKKQLLNFFTDKSDDFGEDNPLMNLSMLPESWLERATADEFWEKYKDNIKDNF